MENMNPNPYEAPRHYAERPRRPWRVTSTGTKILAVMIGLMGVGRLTEGVRLGEVWSVGGGLFLLTFAVALWMAGDQPLFE